jgi:predicted negative regulator of RcsB-dependent stress response
MSADFDRKDLAHDPLQDAFYAAVDYVYRRRRGFILAGVSLLVAFAAVSGYLGYARYSERTDSEALLKADRILRDPALNPDARTRQGTEAYRNFVETHPRSSLAPAAWLTLGRLAWEQKQWDPAGQAFQKVLDQRQTPPMLRTEALLALGKLKEQQGKLAEAKALYDQIGDSFQDVKQLALGRAALAGGDAKQAREHFLQAAASPASNGVTQQAKEALDFLP